MNSSYSFPLETMTHENKNLAAMSRSQINDILVKQSYLVVCFRSGLISVVQ